MIDKFLTADVPNEQIEVEMSEEGEAQGDVKDFVVVGMAGGQDGFSPVVSLTKKGKVSILEITDKKGKHTTEIFDGEDGKDGVGISKIAINSSGRLIITLTNNQNVDLGVVKGENGLDGRGVKNAVITNGKLILTYTDNTQVNLGQVVGADGRDGADGQDGVGIVDIYKNSSGYLVIKLSDGTTKSFELPSGGGGGGGTGADGKDGVGIEQIEIIDGNLWVTLTNGSTSNLGRVVGRDGIDGQDGYTPQKGVDYFDGEKGEKGDKGDPYTLTDTDKAIIVNSVLDALPLWEGGSY